LLLLYVLDDHFRLAKEEARTGQPKRKQEDFLEGPWAAYSISKAADIAFTIALSKAVKEKNITVNGVSDRRIKYLHWTCLGVGLSLRLSLGVGLSPDLGLSLKPINKFSMRL
jgi:hypothetical protein